jgi:glycosyltransferase involved in cell wall biosynthesis
VNPPLILYQERTLRNGELAIEAFKLVKENVRGAKLVFVGSPSVNHFEYVKKLKLEEAISFTNLIYYNVVPNYIAKADVCIIPFSKSLHLRFVLPNKLFDYWSLAKPVVTTDFGEGSRIAKELNAAMVTRDDPKSLAEGILKLLNNPSLAEKLGQRGREVVEGYYNWDVQAKKLIKVCEDLLRF